MKETALRKIYLILLIFLPAAGIMAQNFKWEAGILAGGANYTGDLAPTNFIELKETNPAFGLFARRTVHPSWALRGNLIYSTLSGDDQNFSEPAWRAVRAFSFRTTLAELSVQAEWEMFGNLRFDKSGRFKGGLSPYLFAGAGLLIFDPKTSFEKSKMDELVKLIELDKAADFSNIRPVFPFGAGVRMDLSPRWTVGLEAGLRTAFTDYLDGVSLSGRPGNNDWYGFGMAMVSYRLGEKDTDGDGIADSRDACPTLPGVESTQGCPDADGDGVPDGRDECPLVAGPAHLGGCPDSDGDGIPDRYDRCPDEYGLPERDGCPVRDADGDGVEDDLDACPDVPGLPELQGCPPVDSDGDGVIDFYDRCPDVFGLTIFDGCPDTDNDGIEDAKDACPTVFGVYSNQGCPLEIKPDVQALELQANFVFFETGSDEIMRYSEIDEIVEFLENNPEYKLHIQGHTDNQGSPAFNQRLSEARAKACYEYIVRQGIRPSRLSYEGLGSRFPVSGNISPEDKQVNRRVEFKLIKANS